MSHFAFSFLLDAREEEEILEKGIPHLNLC